MGIRYIGKEPVARKHLNAMAGAVTLLPDLLTFPAWDIDDAVSNEAEYERIWRKYPRG